MILALVVDDHTIFRSGLRRLMLDEADIRVTAEARSGAEAIDTLRRESFDLVLLDITRRTDRRDPAGGARRPLPERTGRAARAGPVARAGRAPRAPAPDGARTQIMLMLLKGTAPVDIGEEMMISIKTVSAHRSHILEKLGVSSTAELVLYAVRQGIIHWVARHGGAQRKKLKRRC